MTLVTRPYLHFVTTTRCAVAKWREPATSHMVGCMASRVVTQLISDVSGEEILDGDGETVAFAYRGTSYTIDLTTQEASDFDAAMSTWSEHATVQGRGRRGGPTTGGTRSSKSSDAKAIRDWAHQQGLDVPARGRIPAEVRAQYEAAN